MESVRGLLGKVMGETLSFLHDFVGRENSVQESERLCLASRERPTGHDQLTGHGRAEFSHESGNPTPGQGNSEIDLWD